MTHSPEIADLAKAILAVQKAVKPVKCNATGSDGKPYADIAAVRKELMPKCAVHGLSVVQGGGLVFSTLIVHAESGQWVQFETQGVEWRNDVSYGPRHALMQAFGMVQKYAVGTSDSPALDMKGLSAAQVQVLINRDSAERYPDGIVGTINNALPSGRAERIGGRK